MSKELDWEETNELADILTNTENPDGEYAITEEGLFDKWGIDCDIFHEIANGIFKLIDFGISPLTETPFVGIVNDNKWIAKKDITQQFIHAIINWITKDKGLPKEVKGYVKTIYSNGNPEFDVTITHSKKDV